MDLTKITIKELSHLFYKKHGQRITPEALSYRLKQGLTREEALEKPLDNRGKTSARKKLRSGRKARRDRVSGSRYCYLHIDVPGNGYSPTVRYVGIGAGGRCLTILGREKAHRDWLFTWFDSPTFQRIEVGISPNKLLNLDWLDLVSRQMWVAVTHPFENAPNFEAKLLQLYNTDQHRLFNKRLLASK